MKDARAGKPVRGARRKPRGAFHHGDLREAAIELAVREVAASGHEAFSLVQLAQKLGVSAPALYRHFADRRALLGEVAQRGFVRFEAALIEAIDAEPDAWTKVLALGRRYIWFAEENPAWFRLQFLSAPAERSSPDLVRTPARYREAIVAALAEAGLDDDMLAQVYFAVCATAHGLAVLLTERVFAPDSPAERARRVDRPLQACVLGLQALAAQRGRARR